jgi:predicted negative regulator of RcsB-dependent stress response
MRNVVPDDFSEYDPALIQSLTDAFDAMCQDKHDMGAKKYGPVKFMKVNSISEAMEELVDMSNYVRYTWIKFALLKAEAEEFEEALQQLKAAKNTPVDSNFVNPFKKV